MSLWIDVTDAGTGSPITDAVFGVSAGNVSAFNEGNGWYYVLIGPSTNFVCSTADNAYRSVCANTDAYTSMSIALGRGGSSWGG